jgi:hypothetical protein
MQELVHIIVGERYDGSHRREWVSVARRPGVVVRQHALCDFLEINGHRTTILVGLFNQPSEMFVEPVRPQHIILS